MGMGMGMRRSRVASGLIARRWSLASHVCLGLVGCHASHRAENSHTTKKLRLRRADA